MKASDIRLRDPFVLLQDDTYYLYGTSGKGFKCWRSEDLKEFEEPVQAFTPPEGFWGTHDFWAPEVHKYKGAFYMFASFKGDMDCRGTAVLRAECPEGPYEPWSDGALTPRGWECLDGTLWAEGGKPYLVFCHEWLQVGNGEILAMPLTEDLRKADGDPVLLFTAKDSGWAEPVTEDGGLVTDGPFLWKEGGTLWMFWASFMGREYAEGTVRSEGGLFGPWIHEDLLFTRDGGHGMIFRDKSGLLNFTLHRPNSVCEAPHFFPLRFKSGKWVVEEER